MSEQLLSADPHADFLSSDPQAGVAVPIPRDASGRPLVSSNLSDGPPSGLEQMLGELAHPQTLMDFARLLGVGVDPLRKAAAGALTIAAASRVARSAASMMANGAVKGAAAVGDVVDPDVIGVVSPRAGKVIQIAQKLRDRAAAATPPAAAAVSTPAAGIPPTIGEAAEASAAPAAAPVATPVAAATTNALPNQRLLNELAIQARRAGVKLTPEMEKTAIEAVGKGATPQQAVRAFAPLAPAEAAPAAAPVWTPTKIRLTADEAKVAAKLIQDGKTDQEVQQAIEAAREFRKRFGTPAPTAAQQRFPKGMRGGAGSQGD